MILAASFRMHAFQFSSVVWNTTQGYNCAPACARVCACMFLPAGSSQTGWVPHRRGSGGLTAETENSHVTADLTGLRPASRRYSRRLRSERGCCWSSPAGFWSPEWPVSPQTCPSSPPEVSLQTRKKDNNLGHSFIFPPPPRNVRNRLNLPSECRAVDLHKPTWNIKLTCSVVMTFELLQTFLFFFIFFESFCDFGSVKRNNHAVRKKKQSWRKKHKEKVIISTN